MKNPTTTNAWNNLEKYSTQNVERLTKSEFNCTTKVGGVSFDYSRNAINSDIFSELVELSKEVDFNQAKRNCFTGSIFNFTEGRAVLHTALRSADLVDESIKSEIDGAKQKVKNFSEKVISGEWKGYTGKAITTIVNIGIGGSDLGPKMIVNALAKYRNHLNYHFVSTIDADYLEDLSNKIDIETTLFVIVSKSFTTAETFSIAEELLKPYRSQNIDISQNVVAVSAKPDKAIAYGIAPENILPMWDWVGGRFSLWSSVGVSIALLLGYDNFEKLLQGAAVMDNHFYNAVPEENTPLIGGLLSIWYSNFLGCQSEAVVAYSAYLDLLVPYLQQVFMESNGKNIDRNGKEIEYTTGNVLWGGIGTEVQHAFMQLIHQGKYLIPVDFIGINKIKSKNAKLHNMFNANLNGQIEALYKGRSIDQVNNDVPENIKPYKTFAGSKPTTKIMLDELNPENLGTLIAYYEHRVFVQGVIWNINSYDQFGVELGKELANKLIDK